MQELKFSHRFLISIYNLVKFKKNSFPLQKTYNFYIN